MIGDRLAGPERPVRRAAEVQLHGLFGEVGMTFAIFDLYSLESGSGLFPFRKPPILRVMAKRGTSKSAPPRAYSVYIIELSRACVKQPCALAPVYVGQTAHTPEHRFGQHKAGGKLAASKAHRFGVRLRYDLMKGIARCANRREAERLEKLVAEALERRGHRVFWG